MLNEKLRKIYDAAGAEALFLESDFLRRYLTDFYSTDGFVLVTNEDCFFFADLRYFEAAEKKLKGSDIKVVEGGYRDALAAAKPYRTLGIPYPFVSVSALRLYEKEGHETLDCMPAFKQAMLIKSEEEISRIQRACEIAEGAFQLLLPSLKEGMTESEVAALLEYNMRTLGAFGVSFDTICAFGENGSVPHYETGSRKLKFGDPVLIDFGCKFEGYCSDITRTFLFGDDRKHAEFKKLHAMVLMAHELVKERLVAGMTGRQADAIARGYLRTKGLAQYFTHSLGHGVGLQIHEYPSLSPRSEDILENGMVFSDEPGIYLAGELGIRIEDTVYLKDGKVVSFMKNTSRGCLIL
ncbi:MAG: aminopeptidase P family protein [Clostridia bacterium]|nr:aminopeptidase P family protein [Clostridia bacterium]